MKAARTEAAAVGDALSLDSNSIWCLCSYLAHECYDLNLFSIESVKSLTCNEGAACLAGSIPGIYFHLR